MNRLLSELLKTSQPTIDSNLRALEQASGQPGIDVRLTAELIGKVRQHLFLLGLDSNDTTASELYYAINNLALTHDKLLANMAGCGENTSPYRMLEKIRDYTEKLNQAKSTWAVKNSVIKKHLQALPPVNTMKLLGYKTVDSLLKRESPAMVLAGARLVESSDWLKRYIKSYKDLTPSDLESRTISILVMPEVWQAAAEKWLQNKSHNVMTLKEAGSILLLPDIQKRISGLCISALPLILDGINEIRSFSSLFKYNQVKSSFSKILVNNLLDDPGKHIDMAGIAVHWRVLHKYFGTKVPATHPVFFEPHLRIEDLKWQKPFSILAELDQSFAFWQDLEFVAVPDKLFPVSFNLIDAALNLFNKRSFKDRQANYFQKSLWHELQSRYINEPVLNKQVLYQLDNTNSFSGKSPTISQSLSGDFA